MLNFSDQEKFDIYRICSAHLHMGEMKFKQRPREEQAEPEDQTGKWRNADERMNNSRHCRGGILCQKLRYQC